MKKMLLLSAFVYGGTLMAQTKLVNQAIVNTTTTVTAPDDEDVSSIQPQGEGGGRMNFRNFADGETKSVTHLKNDMVKTVMKSDMGRSTVIRDNAKKLTTTLIEMMGNKTGFYSTDEEAANMRKRMDSMMQATRNAGDSNARRTRPASSETISEVVYTEETKKIAGYVCKKAYIVNTRILGIKDSSVVWYTPEFKLNNISNTGGLSSFGSMMGGASATANPYSKIDGFVMRYENKMPRGRHMVVEVTKIDLAKEVADKEFEIPKDFDVKPMKEMQNMMQGGGPGGGPGRTFIRVN